MRNRELLAKGVLALEEDPPVVVEPIAVPGADLSADPIDHSLNAGYELDDDVEVETPMPAFPDEVTATVAELVALEARMTDLTYLQQSLTSSGGMSREFAMEAQRLIPDFNQHVPLGFYTDSPTATQYKPALEEVSVGLWAMIAAAAAAILAAIVKIYKYLSGKSKSDDPKQALKEQAASLQAAPQVMEKAAKAIDSADNLVARANVTLKTSDGREYKPKSLHELVMHVLKDTERYERAKKFLEVSDPFFNDIINEGPYTKAVTAVMYRLGEIDQQLSHKIAALKNIMRKDLYSVSSATSLQVRSTSTMLSKPVTVNYNGSDVKLMEIASQITAIRTQVYHTESNGQIQFDKLFHAMASAYRKQAVPRALQELSENLANLAAFEKTMNDVQAFTHDLSADGSPGGFSQDSAEALRQAVFGISSDVAGYVQITGIVKHYASHLEHLAKEASGFAKEVVRKVSNEMNRAHQDIPEKWGEVIEDVNVQMRIMAAGAYQHL